MWAKISIAWANMFAAMFSLSNISSAFELFNILGAASEALGVRLSETANDFLTLGDRSESSPVTLRVALPPTLSRKFEVPLNFFGHSTKGPGLINLAKATLMDKLSLNIISDVIAFVAARVFSCCRHSGLVRINLRRMGKISPIVAKGSLEAERRDFRALRRNMYSPTLSGLIVRKSIGSRSASNSLYWEQLFLMVDI